MKEIVIKPGMAKLIFVAGILSVILGIFVFLITGIVDVVGFIHDKVPLPTRVILITITKFVLAVFFIEIGLPMINHIKSEEHPDAVGYALPDYSVEILDDNFNSLPARKVNIIAATPAMNFIQSWFNESFSVEFILKAR